MGSASKILAQGVLESTISFPGWKHPCLVKLVAVMNASAAWVATATETTDGLVVAGATGVYTVQFPAGRRLGPVNATVRPPLPGTDSQNRVVVVDAAVANTYPSVSGSSVGQLTLYTQDFAGAEVAPVQDSELHVSFWVDYG